MTVLAQVGLTISLSLALAVIARQQWQQGLAIAIALLSGGLWVILDGIWQSSCAFSVVEPSLLVVVLAALSVIAMRGKRLLTGWAIVIFVSVGILTTAIALQWLPLNSTAVMWEALHSGTPMLLAALTVAGIESASHQQGWNSLAAFSWALAIGIVLDSSLYTVFAQQDALWTNRDWLQPLAIKLVDKFFLAAVVLATMQTLGADLLQPEERP